jgi:hypothetical protein
MKKFLLVMSLVAMFLFGCSQSNEDEVRKAKRFEELKGLPLDTVLTRAYKFYEQFQATGDTLLRDSMDDYRNHFFARWELTSDSLCGAVAPDDSLAAELREIYNVVLEFYTKRKYSYVRDRAKRDSLQAAIYERMESLQAALYEMMQKPKHINIIDDILADMERRRKNPDSVRAVQNQQDSVASAKIWGIPLEEAISGLQEDSSSVHNVDYFVQTMSVLYTDTSASDMNELDKINRHRIKRNTWKETKSACLGKTPMGQKVLILNKEYESLLNNFMKANVHESRSERYTILPVKYPFWHPMISVVPHHSGDDFHFESFPAMGGALFNKNHDMVILSVEESFNSGSYYYLAKKNGKWKLIMHKDGWVA